MPEPQSGVLPDGNIHATFMTFELAPGAENASRARKACSNVPILTEEVRRDGNEETLHSVVAVGANAWDSMFGETRPRLLRPFAVLEDGPRKAPATPGDILIHIRSDRADLDFELARRVFAGFGDAVSIVEEIHGFRYLDTRDLTGFVDGTENPTGDHRAEVALVDGEDPEFEGGSYVALQRYIHDLTKWETVAVPEQEQIIGRTKADNIEFKSDEKAPYAHIKRASIKEDGKSLELLRHSMPYGTADEHGLYFIAYCSTPDNFDKMLAQMMVADSDGQHDHLMDYTTAVTGASFFAPSRDFLRSKAD